MVIHPTSNFLRHYLIEPLQRRGRAILALNTRYAGNDSTLIMERCIQDLVPLGLAAWGGPTRSM